jgi:hypothetical protein
VLDNEGRGRKGPEFLQGPGGVAARFGTIRKQVLPFAVRNVELVLAKVKFADSGMTHAADSRPQPTSARAHSWRKRALAADNSAIISCIRGSHGSSLENSRNPLTETAVASSQST